jgi:hypothetical protein
MQRLEVSGAVRPLKWPLGVKWLTSELQRRQEKTQKILALRHVQYLLTKQYIHIFY